MAMRRSIYKLFRLKNIVVVFLLLIFIYLLRILNSGTLDLVEDHSLDHKVQYEEEPSQLHGSFDFTSKNTKRIDWHDYQYIAYDLGRTGIGEHGLPARVYDSEKDLEKELYAANGFNGAVSDKIALNRSLPDIRHAKCQRKTYLSSLPTVSVVIPFHNEHWSTLLRTVYSVINRSPSSLLKEIFLVDDASTKEFLGEKLEAYVKRNLEKVRVLRLGSRSGLITARLEGARRASADVLVFLDSHTEANVNWLPPLLDPIAEDYRTAVCPFIDVVAYDTFAYVAQDEGARGAFDWEFFYKRLPLLPADIDNMPDPFKSPIMAGGLFAISSKFFWELGGYDEGLDIWGGEQYELSFKIWQCGGRMLDAPCSRVGHIYRKFAPFPNPGHGDFVGKNYRRVAEVWMDEYAQYLYQRRPQYLKIDPGDLTKQKAIRANLKCNSFRWFMTQIAFDLPGKYPPIEPKHFAEGKIRSATDPHLCVDAKFGKQMDKLYLTECDTSGELEFQMTWHKDIRSKERSMCWDVPQSKPVSPIVLYSCHLGGGNQLWRYRQDTKQLAHGGNNNCLDHDAAKRQVFINYCSKQSTTQQWDIDKLDYEMLAHWEDVGERVTGPVDIAQQ